MPLSQKPKLLVITGPTATGKSDLAVELARIHNGEIISADSRQVYTGLDIGTGKITTTEMHGIPHHLLDVAHPDEEFSVTEYQKLAQAFITDILARGKTPILCGGTGLYISAVVDNRIFPAVPPNQKLRDELETLTTDELFTQLTTLDLGRANTIDHKNRPRLIRAIEIATALGTVPREPKPESPYETLMIGLMLPDNELINRITKRLETRLTAGMLDEARTLREKFGDEVLVSLGIEYAAMIEYLKDSISESEMRDMIITKSRQYAKRQMTWFKRDQRIQWFHPVLDREQIFEVVKHFIDTNK